MNIFKKIYCRTYQFIFKLALPFMPYRKPHILSSCEDIPDVLKKHKIESVLIVTDKGIVNAGLLDNLVKPLEEKHIRYVVYDKTVPNPTISSIEEARTYYLENSLQGIIALGGGSALDLAKITGARVVKPKQKVEKMKGVLKIMKRLPLLIAIPTTSGTGSEVTIAAVITDDKTHHKYPINDFCLIPRYAVLDYRNTLKLPPHITSTTGMDALTHAVEAYISRTRTRETKMMSLKAIKLIKENLKECYINPNNAEARKNMLFASHYAGISFTKAYVGYVHALAHTLGGKYNIPHGLANAIILPIMLEEYDKSIYRKTYKMALFAGIANKEDSKKDATKKFISWIYQMNKDMNIPLSIKEIKEEDLKELSIYADKEGNPLYPVPKLMDKEKLKQMFIKVKNKE